MCHLLTGIDGIVPQRHTAEEGCRYVTLHPILALFAYYWYVITAKQTREQAASARVRSHPSIMVLKWGLNGELQIVTVKIRNPQLAVFVDKVARAMHEGGTTRFGSSGDESPAAAAMAFSVDQSPHSPTAVESYASILALYLSVLGQIVQSLCGNGYTGPINMRSIMECTDLTRSPPSGRFTSSQIPPTSPAGLAIMRIMSIIATQAKGLKADFARDLMNADCTIVTSMAPVIPVYIAASSNPEAIARDARFMADREEALQLHYKDQPTATPTRQPAKKAGAVQAIDPQPSPAAEPAPVSMDVDQQQHLTEAADRPPPSDGAAPEEQQLPMEQQQQSFTEQQLAEEASAAAPEQDDAPPQDDAALEPPQNESAVDEADNECQEAGQQMMIDDEEEDAEPLDYGEDDDE